MLLYQNIQNMNTKSIVKWGILGTLIMGAIVFSSSCKSVTIPTGVTVVDNFDVNAYMGKWYEIARFDFKHEKDMNNVTAQYSLNDDGSVKVVNRGYNYVKKKWEEAKGKAKFLDNPKKGALKVSFFGPFYSGYNVVAIDPAYENVLVFGESTDYIWFLSRNKTIPESVKNKFIALAQKHGYDTSRLVWVHHD